MRHHGDRAILVTMASTGVLFFTEKVWSEKHRRYITDRSQQPQPIEDQDVLATLLTALRRDE